MKPFLSFHIVILGLLLTAAGCSFDEAIKKAIETKKESSDSTVTETEVDEDEHMKKAMLIDRTKDYLTKKIEEYTRIIKDPHSSDKTKAKAYEKIGFGYLRIRNYPKAIENYREAIKLYPDNGDKAQAHNGMSFVYSYGLKQYDKARENYTKAIELYPDNRDKAHTYRKIGKTYSRIKDYPKARENYTKALELYTRNEDKANVHKEIGDTYSEAKKYDKAIESYTEALKLVKGEHFSRAMIASYKGRAEAYSSLGEDKKAEEDRKRAREENEKLENDIKKVWASAKVKARMERIKPTLKR